MKFKKVFILMMLTMTIGILSFKDKPKKDNLSPLPEYVAKIIKKAKPVGKMYKKDGKLFPLLQTNYWDGCHPVNIGGMCYPACDCKLMIFYVTSSFPFIHQVSVDQVTDSNCLGISKPNVCAMY